MALLSFTNIYMKEMFIVCFIGFMEICTFYGRFNQSLGLPDREKGR